MQFAIPSFPLLKLVAELLPDDKLVASEVVTLLLLEPALEWLERLKALVLRLVLRLERLVVIVSLVLEGRSALVASLAARLTPSVPVEP